MMSRLSLKNTSLKSSNMPHYFNRTMKIVHTV